MTIFLAQWVRDRGKATERRLYRDWGGAPITRALLFGSGGNAALRGRRRSAVETLTASKLPGKRREAADPADVHEEVDALVRVAISALRDRGHETKILHQEVTHYGFRRNFRALKPVALSIGGVSAAAAIAFGITHSFSVSPIAALILLFVYLALICFVVTDKWVETQANIYATAFLGAVGGAVAATKRRI